MKKLILFSSLLVSALSFGAVQKTHILYARDAVLELCPPHRVGCTDKVEIDGKSYMLDALSISRQSLEDIRNAYLFQHLTRTQPGTITGFLVRERHLPNPSYLYDVFKALDFDFAVPR